MRSSAEKLRVDQVLDIRGLSRADGYRQAVDRLSAMADTEILELHLDEGDALNTIPFGLRAEGHEIVVSEPAQQGVRLLVRKRAPVA